MVKPGGTGTPIFVISASSHPLPPSSGRRALEPSALPFAKAYTYLGARADDAPTIRRAVLRLPAIDDPLGVPGRWQRKRHRPVGGPALIAYARPPGRQCQRFDVAATGTYGEARHGLSHPPRPGRLRIAACVALPRGRETGAPRPARRSPASPPRSDGPASRGGRPPRR